MSPTFCKNLRGDLAALQPRWLRLLPAAHRRALVLTIVSMLGWTLWIGLREVAHPWGDLSRGMYTDHFSHMNAARVFPRMGLDIWRVPIADRFVPLTAEQLERVPEDVRSGASSTGGIYFVPGWPEAKPLCTSWSHKTRMYPPGDMLLVAPIAALYHYTSLSFTNACRLLIGWFIVLAHVALFYFFLMFFEAKSRGIDWLACFLAYSQILFWTLQGFYDAVAIVPLILCARYIHDRRGLAACVAYCVGAVLHFRVFFQAPWAIFAAGIMLRDRFWRQLRWRQIVAIAVATACAGLSLYVFWLDWTSLANSALHNALYGGGNLAARPLILSLAVVTVVCGAAFLVNRAWFDLTSLAWLVVVMVNLREFYWWHMTVSMAWIAAPVRRPVVRAARLAFIMCILAFVFNDTITPLWLRILFNPNGH